MTQHSPEAELGVGVDTLMQRMKTLSERREEFSAEERAERFARVELQSVELGASATPRVRYLLISFVFFLKDIHLVVYEICGSIIDLKAGNFNLHFNLHD